MLGSDGRCPVLGRNKRETMMLNSLKQWWEKRRQERLYREMSRNIRRGRERTTPIKIPVAQRWAGKEGE